MDQQYVCTQCGEESDAQGPCPICGLPMVPAHDDDSDDSTSFDGAYDEEKGENENDEEEGEASYNPYEE